MSQPFTKIASSKPVTFLVGNERKQFSMHVGVITGLSRALDVLIKGSCDGSEKLEEARTGIITWRDVDEDTFIRFFQFAYTGDYYSANPTIDTAGSTTANDTSASALATEHVPTATAEDVAEVEEIVTVEDDLWAFPSQKSKKAKKKAKEEKKTEPLWKKFELLQYDDKETAAAQISPTGLTHNHADICLSHAQIYVLADCYGITRLMSLSLRKLHSTLASMIPSAERTLGFTELVRYTFKNTIDKCENPDQLRHMLCLYAACRLEELWPSEDFQDLLKTEGEFSCGVIADVLARLK